MGMQLINIQLFVQLIIIQLIIIQLTIIQLIIIQLIIIQPIMIQVEFRYWGMQAKIEQFIHNMALRNTMLRAHRQFINVIIMTFVVNIMTFHPKHSSTTKQQQQQIPTLCSEFTGNSSI